MQLDCLGGKRPAIFGKGTSTFDWSRRVMQTEQEARLPDISTSATPRPMHSVHVPPLSLSLHVSDQLHCLYNRMPASSVSFALSLSRPSTGPSHLLDTLVRPCPARSQSQYLLGSQPLSSPPAGPSAMPGTVYILQRALKA